MHFDPWTMSSLGLSIGELGGDLGETASPESRVSLLPNFSQEAWKAKDCELCSELQVKLPNILRFGKTTGTQQNWKVSMWKDTVQVRGSILRIR